jgi:hypothetical protein
VDTLERRIDKLQKHFPLLHTEVINVHTRQPAFQLRGQWKGSDVLSTLTYSPHTEKEEEWRVLLKAEILRIQAEPSSRPLWQVVRYIPPSSTGDDETHPRAYLALSVDHVLTDGRGGIQLLQSLLAPTIDHLPYETINTIPKLEDTHHIKPSALFLLPIAFQELLVPRLPVFMQRYLKPYAVWPSGAVVKPPLDCPGEISVFTLPPDVLAGLKKVGKENGVSTLHPILKLSYGIAIWAVHRQAYDKPFAMSMQTPSSVRDVEGSNHGYCTANYTASQSFRLLPQPSTSFWVEAAKIATTLSSPNGKAEALQSMGLLGYLPDPEPTPESPRTGWETFLLSKASSLDPFPGSLGFSNLGYVDLPDGAEDLFWSQVVSPFAPVYEVNVFGCEKGLRVVSIWRDGSGTSRKEVEEVERVWERVLRRLVDGEVDTLGQLVA